MLVKVDGQGRALPCANAGWTREGMIMGGHYEVADGEGRASRSK